jgi:hypothetical protein
MRSTKKKRGRKMKKGWILFTALFLTGLWTSCSGPDETQSQLDILRETYGRVGLAHNEALMLVYRDLAAECAETRLTWEKGMEITDRCLGSTPIPSLNAIIGPGKAEALPPYVTALLATPGIFAKPAANAVIMDALSDSIGIIKKHKGIYDRIVNILDSEPDTEAKIRELEQLYLVIDAEVESGEEKAGLMNGLSTVVHSLDYWDEHWHEWQETLTPGMQKTAAVGIIGAIGIIDGAGAVLGTVEGFLETQPGEDGRGWTILKTAAMEGCKASVGAALSIILL